MGAGTSEDGLPDRTGHPCGCFAEVTVLLHQAPNTSWPGNKRRRVWGFPHSLVKNEETVNFATSHEQARCRNRTCDLPLKRRLPPPLSLRCREPRERFELSATRSEVWRSST